MEKTALEYFIDAMSISTDLSRNTNFEAHKQNCMEIEKSELRMAYLSGVQHTLEHSQNVDKWYEKKYSK